MTHCPRLLLLLWLSGSLPLTSRAMEYLCRFPASDQVTISGVATDPSGNTYVCGYVATPGVFPGSIRIGATNTIEPGSDAFVMKLAPDGTRMVTVLLGGERSDAAQKIAVDSFGNVIVLGYTASRAFPLRDPLKSSITGISDLFITKFDPTCTNLLFSTYVGGLGYESASALGLDGQGEIFFAGATSSDDFPAEPDPFPWRDSGFVSFLAKLSSDGSRLRFASRFGGAAYATIEALAVDKDGNACVTGTTSSGDFPTLNAFQPRKTSAGYTTAYVAKVGPDGTPVFSTFLSGDYFDDAQAIAVNAMGEIVVAGTTVSEIFPALGVESPVAPTNWVNKVFLAKFNAAGTALLATNLYRFSSFDRFAGLAVAPGSRIVGAGTIRGYLGLPFFASIDESNAVSIALGRTGCEPLASAEAIAFDEAGNLVVAGREQGVEYPALDSYVARYAMDDWQLPSPAQVRILSPVDGARVSSHQPAYLEAAATGGTGPASSVKFYDGRRLVAVATNAPFGITWKKVSRGRHRLTAVAHFDGRAVTSCVVNITAQLPPNDAFPGRTLLKGENVEVAGDTTGATGEGDPSSMPTVWYSWKAPRDGLFEIAVSKLQETSYTSYYLAIFTGSRLKNLVAVGESYRPSVTLRARRGEVFRLRVGTYSSEDGRFRLQIRAMTPPANDDFANAALLTGDSPSAFATLRDASSEPGESYGQTDPHYLGDPTVWFRWTAPRTGLFLISAAPLENATSVDCWIGNSISNLIAVGQHIFGETNGTALYAQEGIVYYLKLRGQNTNNVTLSIAPYAPPPNDNFAERFVIASGFNSTTGTLIGATSETGEPEGYFPPRSVWWSWTPETNGVYRVSTTPFLPVAVGSGGVSSRPAGGSSEQVRVFRGDELTNLVAVPNLVGGAFPYGGEMVVQAFAGTNYQLAVEGSAARFTLHIVPVSTPANDNFNAAIELSGANILKSGTTYAATSEPGERSRGIPLPGNLNTDSVWYRWIAPSNGFFAFTVDGAGLLEIYGGATLDTSNLIGGDDQRYVLQVSAGTEYRLAVLSGRRFTLSIQPAQRPANDDFANRQVIFGLNIRIASDARDATGEPGEPLFQDHSQARRSLWYSWTAPTNGSFRLVSTSAAFDHLSVFTGDVLTNLARVAEGDGFIGIQFDATAGVTYQVAVDPPSHRMQFSLDLSYLTPPRNDGFADRLRLTGSEVSIMASNTGASREVGEPLNGPAAAGHTVWWTWRAPRTGRVTFDVQYGGEVLGVYTGNWLTRLLPLTDTNRNESIYNLPVRSGQDYQISVDDYRWEGYSSPYSGGFQLRLHYTSSPTNDDFAHRRSFSDQASGDLEGGSLEAGESGPSSSTVNSSVWWTWTAPSNGTCRFEVSSSSWTPSLTLFTGDDVGQLRIVPAECPCSSSRSFARVAAGTTYVVRILGPATSIPYTLAATLLAAPVNDDFTNRITLAGAPLTVIGSNYIARAEAREPAHYGLVARRSVWWSWTAPSDGLVRITLLLHPEMAAAVYTGDRLENLESVTSSVGSASFDALEGTTYQVAVDTTSWNTIGYEEFSWELAFQEAPPVPPGTGSIILRPPLPPPIYLIGVSNPATNLVFALPGMIETSTNLVDWLPYTNAPVNPTDFRVVPSTNEPYRFFRVR